MNYSLAILLPLPVAQDLGLSTAGHMAHFLCQLLVWGWAGLRGQDVSESSGVGSVGRESSSPDFEPNDWINPGQA